MISVFFDTNAWLPAVLSEGFSRRLVRFAEDRRTVFISGELVDEVVEKLAVKFRASWETIQAARTLMGKTGRAFTETVAPYAASPDPDDAILLAQALAAGCSHFVTNDGKLLALDRIGEMLLVTPRAFAEIIGMV